MKKALIIGISGQDGSLLAKLLLSLGYKVIGTSRDSTLSRFDNLNELDLLQKIDVASMSLVDTSSVFQTLKKYQPDEIYNLSGQSSVGLSFEQPVETFESIATGVLNLLEAVRSCCPKARVYNACSSESFGETTFAANEDTPFHPISPYGIAKATAFWTVKMYREAYRLDACSGILFNHESPLRPQRFVTQKIVAAAVRISKGSKERLRLGNIQIERDWGWAEDYVRGMHAMLQLKSREDFVLATGKAYSLKEFIETAFGHLGLDSSVHIEIDPTLSRPLDIKKNFGDAQKAKRLLNWSPTVTFKDIVKEMVDRELQRKR